VPRAADSGGGRKLMETGIWVFIHILLLVFWLGTDLGVFILARAARRADLSFPQRAVLLQYGMVIDVIPRICLTISFPVGLHLTASMGYLSPPPAVFAAAWAIGLGWLALLYAMHKAEGTPRQARLSSLNLALQGVLGLAGRRRAVHRGLARLEGAVVRADLSLRDHDRRRVPANGPGLRAPRE
jgi:hypothetical protein